MAHNIGKGATNWSCETHALPKMIPRSTPFENCFFIYANLGTYTHQIMKECIKDILIEGSITVAKWKYDVINVLPRVSDVFFKYGKLYSYYEGKIKKYTIGRVNNGKFTEFTTENYIEELMQQDQYVFDFLETKNDEIIVIPTIDIEAPPTKSISKGTGDWSNAFIIDQTNLNAWTSLFS